MKRGVAIGICLSLLAARVVGGWHAALDNRIPVCAEGTDTSIRIRVVNSTSVIAGRHARLEGTVVSHQRNACVDLNGKRVRLNWYGTDAIEMGSTIDITARLKRPWGMVNPGGFNYERWLLANRYAATGYIRIVHTMPSHYDRKSGQNHQADGRLDRFRTDLVNEAVVQALAFGTTDAIPASLWRHLRNTGTIHLMVVSGLHVSILAGLVYMLVAGGLRLIPRLQVWIVPRHTAALCSLAAVWMYAIVAGLGAPILRASLMASAFGLAALTKRSLSAIWGLLVVAAIVLVIEPTQIAQQGFWLSFAAVGCLLTFFSPRQRRMSWVRTLVCSQMVLVVGLAPVLSALGIDVPAIGGPANLVVVPLMSLFVVPVLFAGLAIEFLTNLSGPLYVVDVALSLVIAAITWFDGLGWPTMGPRFHRYCFAALIAALASSVPTYPILRLAACLAAFALLLPTPALIPKGHFSVRVLDVGQGSAAIVETATKRILVDTGAMSPSGFNPAEAAIIPTLRKTGADGLDLVVVTHLDNDHAGGLTVIREYASDAQVIATGAQCLRAHWEWDNVRFSTRMDRSATSANGRSCTLLIQSRYATAYLSGDINRRSELTLHRSLPRDIDFLIAPHHGSRTSSSWQFVRQLRPDIVVFPTGRANRYGHPHPQVVRRYQAIGAQILHTGLHGAVLWQSWRPDSCLSERGFACGHGLLPTNSRNTLTATSR